MASETTYNQTLVILGISFEVQLATNKVLKTSDQVFLSQHDFMQRLKLKRLNMGVFHNVIEHVHDRE